MVVTRLRAFSGRFQKKRMDSRTELNFCRCGGDGVFFLNVLVLFRTAERFGCISLGSAFQADNKDRQGRQGVSRYGQENENHGW